VDKIARLRALLDAQSLDGVDLAVDGGIGEETIRAVASAGATVAVAGSAVFGPTAGRSIAENLAALRRAAQAGGT
jgi:ribulose-phosphate 3-epimerase